MRTIDHFMSFAVSQLPVVRFEHVRTVFDSTQSQESRRCVNMNLTQQCALWHMKNVLILRTVQSYLSLCGRACHFAETPAGFDIIFPITVGCWMSFVKLKAKKLISLVEYELKCLPMKQVNIKSSSTYHYMYHLYNKVSVPLTR